MQQHTGTITKTPSSHNPLSAIISSLIDKRKVALADIARIRSDIAEMRVGVSDVSDMATNVELLTEKSKSLDKLFEKLHKIEAALKMAEDGEYGYCQACGDVIDVKRLEAYPTATLCIDCKEITEATEKKGGKVWRRQPTYRS